MRKFFNKRLIFTCSMLLAAALCVALGLWQSGRVESKRALIAEFTELAGSPSLPAASLGADWRRYQPIDASGYYQPEQFFLLDNRVLRGQSGYELYQYFRFARQDKGYDGIWVNRGWLPHSYPRQARGAPVSAGLLTISGHADLPWLWGWQPPTDPDLPQFVSSVNLDYFDRGLRVNSPPYALKLAADAPGVLQVLPDTFVSVGPERHLAYALQWFAFAAVLLVGTWLARRSWFR